MVFHVGDDHESGNRTLYHFQSPSDQSHCRRQWCPYRMTRSELVSQIFAKKSCLTIGLDTDLQRIPDFLKDQYEDPVFEFNRQIIDHTSDLCVCYKLN